MAWQLYLMGVFAVAILATMILVLYRLYLVYKELSDMSGNSLFLIYFFVGIIALPLLENFLPDILYVLIALGAFIVNLFAWIKTENFENKIG